MAGAPDYQRLTATLPSRSQAIVTQTDTTSCAASGGVASVTFYSPSGTLSYVQAFYCSTPAPTGATSGTTLAQVLSGPVFTGASVSYTASNEFNDGAWGQGTGITQTPPLGHESYWLGGRTSFDSVTGIECSFVNSTDVATTQERKWQFGVVREDLP